MLLLVALHVAMWHSTYGLQLVNRERKARKEVRMIANLSSWLGLGSGRNIQKSLKKLFPRWCILGIFLHLWEQRLPIDIYTVQTYGAYCSGFSRFVVYLARISADPNPRTLTPPPDF